MLWIALSSPENQLCHFCLDWYCLRPAEVTYTSQLAHQEAIMSDNERPIARNFARNHGSEIHLDNTAAWLNTEP